MNPDIWPLVIQDMEDRNEFGIRHYGVPLRPYGTGLSMLKEAYAEALDLCAYLRAEIYRQENGE